MFAVGIVPSALLLIGMLRSPYSPRWLVYNNKMDSATRVLQKLRGIPDVSGELQNINRIVKKERSGRWSDLMAPMVRMPMVVGLGLAILQQMAGINTISYYLPTLFEFAGVPSATASIATTLGIGIVEVLGAIGSILLIDRVGRRPLLLWSIAAMALSLSMLGVGFYMNRTAMGKDLLGMTTITSLVVYNASVMIGIGPMFWVLISEIFPFKVRGHAMGMAAAVNYGMNFILSLTFLTLIRVLGPAMVFWLFALVSIGTWFFVYRLVPETRGLTLEEIEEHFRAGRHPRDLKGTIKL
jgi:MFS transporter, SP family, galactose:H+ symporter